MQSYTRHVAYCPCPSLRCRCRFDYQVKMLASNANLGE